MPEEPPDGVWMPTDVISHAKNLEDAIAMAYGYLWHVKTDNYKLAYEARKALRDVMTYEQRGDAISRVRELMGYNA